MVTNFGKFILDFDLQQLDTLICSVRSALRFAPAGRAWLAQKHLEQAIEQYESALAALHRSNFKFKQTQTIMRTGLMHAYLAYRLVRTTVLINQDSKVTDKDRLTEAQQQIGQLGKNLTDLKTSVEVSNYRVSDIAQRQVELAMDLYDAALSELKTNQPLMAKRAAQAGLLQLSFAVELITCDNGGSLLGLAGLANPLTNCPVRKLNKLASMLVQLYALGLPPLEDDCLRFQLYVRKAIQNLNTVIIALSRDNLVHAQAEVFAGLNEAYMAQKVLEPELNQFTCYEHMETKQLARKFNPARLELHVLNIKELLKDPERLYDQAINSLDRLLRNYQRAVRAFDSGDISEAHALIMSGLDEVARVRKLLFKADGTCLVKLDKA